MSGPGLGVWAAAGLGLLGVGFAMVMAWPGGDAGAVLMVLGGVLAMGALWWRIWRGLGPAGRILLATGPVVGLIAALAVWAGMPPRDRMWIGLYGPVMLGGWTLGGMALAGVAWLLGSRAGDKQAPHVADAGTGRGAG